MDLCVNYHHGNWLSLDGGKRCLQWALPSTSAI
jgi:hypothetical protein